MLTINKANEAMVLSTTMYTYFWLLTM